MADKKKVTLLVIMAWLTINVTTLLERYPGSCKPRNTSSSEEKPIPIEVLQPFSSGEEFPQQSVTIFSPGKVSLGQV